MTEAEILATINNLKSENKKLAKRLAALEGDGAKPRHLMVESIRVGSPNSPYSITLATDPNLGGIWIKGQDGSMISFFNKDGKPMLQLVEPNKQPVNFEVNS